MATTQSTERVESRAIDLERGEETTIQTRLTNEPLLIPITRKGFEALLKRSCEFYDLTPSDRLKQVLAGYIHHIPNDVHETTIEKIAQVLYKSIANESSWTIDQEIKEATRLAIAAEQAEQKAKVEARLKAEAEEKRKHKSQKKGKLNGAHLTSVSGGEIESSGQTATTTN